MKLSPAPTDTIWTSFESLKLQSMLYFAGRNGLHNTYKKVHEMTIGVLPLSWNGKITKKFLGMNEVT